MHDYDFTLTFRLPQLDADPEQYLQALTEAGCDDATIGIGQRGRIALDFTRRGQSALAAITSGLQAVKRAIPGVELVEAAPDFVGLTDVAALLGCSRQNLRQLMLHHPQSFPLAVHEGALSLWHLRPVLAWVSATQKRSLDPALVEVAEATMQVNIAKEAHRLPGARLPAALRSLFA